MPHSSRRGFTLSSLGVAGSGLAPSGASATHTPLLYDVTAYGAKGDGTSLATAAIQRAVDAAHASGGGVVLFPPGRYISGTIELKSRVCLHLTAGAIIAGSKRLEDYPERIPAARSYTDLYTRRSLIYAEGQEETGIEGAGTLDGQGTAFSGPYLVRPYMIRMINCRRVHVQDVTLLDSPMWVQHYLLCQDTVIDGVTVHSRVNHNNDGIDIDSCRRVRISNCDIWSGDDAIVLKSTTAEPCRDVTVSNCVISSRCNAIKLGTESNGGFVNIAVSNCSIYDTRLAGIALECVDGGTLDGVNISNIVMRDTGCPIFIRLGDRGRPFEPAQARWPAGHLRNVTISNVQATGESQSTCSITGLAERPVENVLLSNIHLQFAGGGAVEQTTREIPEKRDAYPEHSMFGALPAFGFYVRHARGLTMENIRLATTKPDQRHSLGVDDAEDVALHGLRAPAAPIMVRANSVNGMLISGCRAAKPTGAFIKVTGKSSAITLTGNDLSAAATPIEKVNS